MKKFFVLIINLYLVLFITLSLASCDKTPGLTPVLEHGTLGVTEGHIVDKNNKIFQIRGISSHGLGLSQNYQKYINEDSLKYVRDYWNVNTIRLAFYTPEDCGNNQETVEVLKNDVRLAIKTGLYVIIDWHVLKEKNPNVYLEESKEFFKDVAKEFKDYPNVIYEICNEPNDCDWDKDVRPYAMDVIKTIKSIDQKSLIICGSSNWSTDLDKVYNNPIKGYKDIIYSYHFSAGSFNQKDRDKLEEYINKGVPIMISECNMVEANGNGELNYDEANQWFDIINQNQLGYIVWQLTNKNESSSLIRNDCFKLTDWDYEDLTPHGKWFVDLGKQSKTKK